MVNGQRSMTKGTKALLRLTLGIKYLLMKMRDLVFAPKRVAQVVAASVVALGLLVGVSPTMAIASPKTEVKVATGSVTCQKLTGTISFSPPVRKGGNQPLTLTVVVHARDCSTSHSNVAHVSGGNITVVNHRATNGCGKLGSGQTGGTATEQWLPSSIASTNVSYTGFYTGFNGPRPSSEQDDVGLWAGTLLVSSKYPHGVAFGLVIAKGSFAMGTPSESMAGIVMSTSTTLAEFRAACLTSAGLGQLSVVSGSENL